MDRREALKKIAVGGAVAATGPVILSSPAFAFDAPSGSPTIDVVVVGPSTAGVTFVGVSCPASATGDPTFSGTVTVSGAPNQGNRVYYLNTQGTALPQNLSSLAAFNLLRYKLSPAPAAPEAFVSGDAFTVRINGTYTCSYASGSNTASFDVTRTATYNGATWTVV